MDSNEVVVHIDETLARYSDLLFGTAITVYVLAMFLFLWALGSARIRRIQSAEARQLVGAVAGGDDRGPRDAVEHEAAITLNDVLLRRWRFPITRTRSRHLSDLARTTWFCDLDGTRSGFTMEVGIGRAA